MPTTSPDNIYYSDTSTTLDINAISAAEATSVQQALNARQRFEYVWANAAARTGQTGMVTGSVGYQVDTKSEYIYEAGAWRLKLSYAEYTMPAQTVPTGVAYVPTGLVLNSSLSTDSTFTSTSGSTITFAQAGVYSIAWTISALASTGANSYAAIYSDAAHLNLISLTGFTQGAVTVPIPFYRTAAANSTIYPIIVSQAGTGVSMSGTIRIGRLG